jgi:small subunit ribosomal protein S8
MLSLSDPIGDLLTRIRNAQRARHDRVRAPWSRIKQELAEILKSGGWISEVNVLGEDPRRELEIVFTSGRPMLELKRISKPGRRVYRGVGDLKPILQGYGIAILTTSQGLMTDKDARAKGVGGEVLCTIA